MLNGDVEHQEPQKEHNHSCRYHLMRMISAMLVSSFFSPMLSGQCTTDFDPIAQVSLSNGSAFVSKLAIVGDTIHMVYDGGPMYYSRSIDTGKSWSVPIEIISDDSMPGQIWSRPISANGSNVYVTWENRTASGSIRAIKIRRSVDGGTTWQDPQELVVNDTQPGFQKPVVASHGTNVFVVISKPISGLFQEFLLYSSDRGATWSNPDQIATNTATHHSYDICATNSSLHWVSISRGDVVHTRSTDLGGTWTNEVVISDVDVFRAWDPHIEADDNNVYVCWQDAKYGSSSGFSGTVLFRKSVDAGSSWLPNIPISALPSATFSSLSVSGRRIVVAWDDERFGSLQGFIQARTSSDVGMTWCDEFTVGDTLDVNTSVSVIATTKSICAVWSAYAWSGGGEANIYSRYGRFAGPNSAEWVSDIVANPNISLNVYPIPLNAHGVIVYRLARQQRVELSLFDIIGRRLLTIYNGMQAGGDHSLPISLDQFTSGCYFVSLNTDDGTIWRKILIAK